MNIIFLDVDGELTYSNYQNEETANIDIDKVKLLKEICDRTNAKVVISSSWRGNRKYIPKIYWTLVDILKNNGITVVGNTPVIETKLEIEEPTTLSTLDITIKHGTGRAAEIQKYIEKHNVKNFVILDDEDWDWKDYGYDTHWVRPTWYGDGGLKREHVEQAVKILSGDNEDKVYAQCTIMKAGKLNKNGRIYDCDNLVGADVYINSVVTEIGGTPIGKVISQDNDKFTVAIKEASKEAILKEMAKSCFEIKK